MTTATIKLVNADAMIAFYTKTDTAALARKMLAEGYYKVQGTVVVEGTGEDAAEEVFDLTNNPSRQGDRESLYGRYRSVSVGDIIEVDGVSFVCCPYGWETI